MKRLIFALAILGALLLGSPSSIYAQQHKGDDPGWVYIPQSVAGTTFCVPGGVRTVIDMEVTDDMGTLEITRKHELIHQRQMKDRALCHPTWTQLLIMETEAYCDADAALAVDFFKANPEQVYIVILGALHAQFFYSGLSADVVTRAWYDRCGKQLGIPQPH